MAKEEKKPENIAAKAAIIKRVSQPGSFPTDEERQAIIDRYANESAVVVMLKSELDTSDPLNPKQKGKTYDHWITAESDWKAFLQTHVLLTDVFVKVKQLPKGWMTVEEFNKQQVALKAKYEDEQAKKAAEPIIPLNN